MAYCIWYTTSHTLTHLLKEEAIEHFHESHDENGKNMTGYILDMFKQPFCILLGLAFHCSSLFWLTINARYTKKEVQ